MIQLTTRGDKIPETSEKITQGLAATVDGSTVSYFPSLASTDEEKQISSALFYYCGEIPAICYSPDGTTVYFVCNNYQVNLTYNWTYNGNGGTIGGADVYARTVNYIEDSYQGSAYNRKTKIVEDLVGTGKTVQRTGYTFKNWGDGEGNTYTDSSLHATNVDMTFGANWTANTYYISYASNGGSGTMGTQTATYDQSITLTTNAFTKDYYSFGGWSHGSSTFTDGESVINLTSVKDATYTMTAIWNAILYNITYSIEDGITVTTGGSTVLPATYTVESSNIPYEAYGTKKGYSVNLDPTSIPAGSTGDKTITATWYLTTYNITYSIDDGITLKANGSTDLPTTYNYETPTISYGATGSKLGYGIGISGGVSYHSTGDKTITATWTLITYKITYSTASGITLLANGSTTLPTTYNVNTSTITYTTNSVKTGYTATISPSSIAKGSTGAKTITSTWSPIAYTITYTLNGGTNVSTNPSTYTIEDDEIVFDTPIYDGYKFLGWSLPSIPAGSTGNQTTAASWKQWTSLTSLKNAAISTTRLTWSTITTGGWTYTYNYYRFNASVYVSATPRYVEGTEYSVPSNNGNSYWTSTTGTKSTSSNNTTITAYGYLKPTSSVSWGTSYTVTCASEFIVTDSACSNYSSGTPITLTNITATITNGTRVQVET